MTIGLRITPCASGREVSDLVVAAERGGFDEAWMTDSQLIWRDVWVALGLAAARTSSIRLGTNVTNPVTRDATVLASAAATVAEVAGGRMTVGLGVGDSAVRVIGRRPARIAETRRYVEVLRGLWGGEFVDFDGHRARLRGTPPEPIPVYIGATGPKMLQFAGECGDGVIALTGVDEASLEYRRSNVGAGAARAGKDPAAVDVAQGILCQVTDDPERARELVRPFAAGWAVQQRDRLEAVGVTPPSSMHAYPDLVHAEDWDEATRLTRWIPDDLLRGFCDRFALIGSADEIVGRLVELEAAGIDHLFVRDHSSYELPTELCTAFTEEILPRYRARA